MNTITNETLDKIDSISAVNIFQHSRLLQVCTVLLFAQLGLAVVLGLTQQRADFNSGQQLFALEEGDINSVTIGDPEETIELIKRNDKWVLNGNDSLPADSARLNTLLDSLINLKVGLPVASSANSREQLEVADDNYQRKLVINNDTGTTFLLGTSPGLRKAHLRRDGSDEIYSASLPVSSIPASIDNWLDKSLLALKNISRLSTDSITFESTGTGEDKSWKILDHSDPGKSLDTKKLTTLVSALESLSVTGFGGASAESSADPDDSGVTDSSDKNEDNPEPETVELSVTSEGKDFKITLEKNDNNTFISRSDIDQVFSASTSVFEQIAEPLLEADWLVDADVEKDKEANSNE
ncbi:MAG: DUF4340 domain-containing protein [Granulosicoccus sp.]|nr:DUF4340 domain-containing protein [Granulosicoccus sp.]